MEGVKLNQSINWVGAKGQSAKANRFKVLNGGWGEKNNLIKEPRIQRAAFHGLGCC